MKKVGLIIFIAALSIGIVLSNVFSFGSFAFKSPISLSFGKVKGSGDFVTEKRNVGEFKNIEVSGAFEVQIIAGKESAIEIDADDNLLPLIKTEVSGDTLEIGREKRFSTHNRVKIRVFTKNVENLETSGASSATLTNLDNEFLNVDSSGVSRVTVAGKTNRLKIEMSGVSQIKTKELSASNVSIDGSGASRADVFASEALTADLSGASHVDYSGNPTEINKKTSGGSCLKQHK